MLVINTGQKSSLPVWRTLFGKLLPDMAVHWIDDPEIILSEVDYALVWSPPAGRLAQFPNLKCIISSGAGVDGILADPQLPKHIPLIRMQSPTANRRMAEYLLLNILGMARDMKTIVRHHDAKKWEVLDPVFELSEMTVGIMGLGQMGAHCANYLRSAGCNVIGWSRSKKDLKGIVSFAGEAGLTTFLSDTDILICMLPLTPQTQGILCASTFSMLPKGAALINVARGRHLVEDDLLQALQTGQLRSAVLDVFCEEPLPQTSPLWDCPGILLTSHIAANAPMADKAKYAASIVRIMESGGVLPKAFDHALGY